MQRRALAVSVFALALLTLACCWQTIWASDFWWQLATGRYIAENGIPSHDAFTYASAGREWIEMRWLFCYGLYQLVNSLGFWSATLLETLLIAGAFGFCAAAAYRFCKSGAFAIGLAGAALFASSERFFVRPEAVSYLFFALFLFLLVREGETASYRALWLVPLQIIWTNSSTLFALGPAVVFVWVLSFALKRSWPSAGRASLVFIGVCAACLINPYVIRGALFPLQLFTELHGTAFKEYITELRGPLFYGIGNSALLMFYLLSAGFAAAVVIKARRMNLFLLLMAGATLYLAFTAIRNVPLFCIAVAPAIASAIGTISARLEKVAATALLAGSITVFYIKSTNWWSVWHNNPAVFGAGITKNVYPVKAVEFLREHGLDGRLYNTMSEGSYLAWMRIPNYIDPRLEVQGEEHFAEYMQMQQDISVWKRVRAREKFTAALVAISNSMNGILAKDDEWGILYFDETAAVWAPKSAGLKTIQTDAEYKAMAGAALARMPAREPPKGLGPVQNPAPYRRLDSFLRARGIK